jgi:hypothetical protein
LGTPRPCLSEESASAPELASALRCPLASRARIGKSLSFWRWKLNFVPSWSDNGLPLRFLIWIGSDQEKTFGPTITGLIYNNIPPERMILWDSKKRGGRPDSVKLLKEVWDSFGAEVIFITSNMQGNDEMMQGCRAGTL